MMKIWLVVVLCVFCYTTEAFRVFGTPKSSSDVGSHWAVLVAGSSSWMNYRHQADVCHAYQVLHSHGIPDDHIIVMMYDDIANNDQNPKKGEIYNHPNGPDVYSGVLKDYTGEDVTPENFLAILEGNEEAVKGKGSGRVLKSGPNDNVFVYFSDHGGTDLIAFPSSELMEADLQKTLEKMAQEKKFKDLVFYLEACESGSMFNSYKIDNVYVTTASGPDESSYACYYDDTLQTYLGDVYSVKWLENSDSANFNKETLLKQFRVVKKETNTSKVHQYGDVSFDKDTLGDFEGDPAKAGQAQTSAKLAAARLDAVPSPEVPMAILHRRLMAATDPRKRSQILQEITALGKTQQKMVSVLEATVRTVLNENGDGVDRAMTRHGTQVTDWDCYKTAVRHFSQKCFPFNKHDYAVSLLYVFANLCEEQVPSKMITYALDMQCN